MFFFHIFRNETDTYRIVHSQRVQDMWNEVFRDHQNSHPDCDGKLQWDTLGERQRGLCWQERTVCSGCNFKSKYYKLYKEVDTGKPGPKPASANIGAEVGLMHTRSGNTALRDVFLAAGLPAPSLKSMNKMSNNVGQQIIYTNDRDLKRQRNKIKEVISLRDDLGAGIPVESDCSYNNAAYSGVGKTPFQPATQVVCTVSENATSDKAIIGMTAMNKLCPIGARKGYNCPKHDGHCASNLKMNRTIGDESQWAHDAVLNLLDEGVKISHITTDTDGKAGKGVQKACESRGLPQPESLLDSRHLSGNQRKKIRQQEFSEGMFAVDTKAEADKLQGRFANDVAKRCQFEYGICYSECAGELNVLKRKIWHVPAAMTKCYQGNHSDCRKRSFACAGKKRNNWLRKSPYLSKKFAISCTEQDHSKLIECINFKLGQNILEQTRLNTNSQKSEATVRSLRRSLPKPVTYARNFEARANTAIHSVNHGTAESITRLCHSVGCPVAQGTRVARGLLGRQKGDAQRKRYQKLAKTKRKRIMKTRKMYKLYDKLHMNDQKKNDTSYKKYDPQSEHSYFESRSNPKALRHDHTYRERPL